MKKIGLPILVLVLFAACTKKTGKDRAISLVQARYENSDTDLDFDKSHLDSLYTISPKAYADSLKKGEELDAVLAGLETEIEHNEQATSDSIGLISAALTKRRYKLLDMAKNEPQFMGWTLSGVKVTGKMVTIKNYNFDKAMTKLIP